MAKKTTSTKSQSALHSPLATPAFFVAVVAVILSIFTLVYAISVERNASIESAHSEAVLDYKISRAVFCQDNNITPCDNVSLREWNAAHDEDMRFTVMDI